MSKKPSSKEYFDLLKVVLPEEQELITVPPETQVGVALDILKKHQFSQVPVVEGNEVLGSFSHRSFAEGIQNVPEKERNILEIPVEEFLEELHFASINDKLSSILEEFNIKDTVFLGTEDRLQGIITSYDALLFFYKAANPYLQLKAAELAIRDLIRVSLGDDWEDKLQSIIKRTLGEFYLSIKCEVPRKLEELTFDNYKTLVTHGESWSHFQSSFGGTRHYVAAKLKDLPELRNTVFHFRRELTFEEDATLRQTCVWLYKRIRIVEAEKSEGVE